MPARSTKSTQPVLGVMAKYWTPGQVKTRLGRCLGMHRAAEVHRLFVQCLLRHLGGKGEWEGCLVVWPPQRLPEMEAAVAGSSWLVVPQSEGDLGAKMRAFVQQQFRQGKGPVVLLGADVPDLPREHIRQAFRLLESHTAVLGPSHDGGYYLLGLSRDVPELFQQIAWGTSQVWEQSVARLRQAGVPWVALPPWPDVDYLDDLHALRQRLRQSQEPVFQQLGKELHRLLSTEQ